MGRSSGPSRRAVGGAVLEAPRRLPVGRGTVRVRGAREPAAPERPRASPYGKRRALALGSVYVLFGIHIAHWKLNGATLAPLELNEVMYTLEAGVVTAGFLFMATLFIASAVVGRFFCSWACHILALEDLCAWILKKLRIRPKPVRSRVLLLVPPAALFYMFVWPQIARVQEGKPFPPIRILTDEDGWASFVTTDFWRNLPDPWIAGLTFLVCGFAMIYVLGTRSFCLYGCPYGAVFKTVDRVAPGRILLSGDCEQCGTCTSVCTSGVRVHEEIARHGKVVDPACLKDLDCVGSCPHDAIRFGFTKPALFESFRAARRRLPREFPWSEEILMAGIFVASLLTFRGLYVAVPFLMTLGIGGCLAYLSVLGLRLARRSDVGLRPFTLKAAGRLTGAGRTFAAAGILFGGFFVHSAFVRYHEASGQRAFDAVSRGLSSTGVLPRDAHRAAIAHLTAALDWGLVAPIERAEQLASLYLAGNDSAAAEPHLRRIVSERPDDSESRMALAGILARRGRVDEAIAGYRDVLDRVPDDARASAALGSLLAESGRFAEAVKPYRVAARARPDSVEAQYNLAVVLAASGDAPAAIAAYRAALALAPSDADALNNLGFLLAAQGDLDAAEGLFRRAIAARPGFAHPHFNLGRLHERRGESERAVAHYREAAALDPAYAALLATPNASDARGAGSPR